MKLHASSVSVLLILALGIACAGMLHATQDRNADRDRPLDLNQAEMTITTPDDVEWKPGPPSLPEGSEFAVLEGNPAEEGFFNLRLKLPDGYRISPHTHPKVERVTVLSGNFRFAMGEKFSDSQLRDLEAGSFFIMPPGMAHFAQADGETIVQLNALGPWEINYINPDDDPRQTQE